MKRFKPQDRIRLTLRTINRRSRVANSFETHDGCCRISTITCPCPVCGNTGRKVSSLTLDHHLPPGLRQRFEDEATFCLNPLCEVIYCGRNGTVIRRDETVLPVTVKNPADNVYVCYCFKHRRGDLRRDLMDKGETGIPGKIRQGIMAGRCDCERQNPQGACCLGNVAKAIREIQSELSSTKRA